MKKINKKGFTLIELLAVITIMGILMIVAIPAVSRTIENARKDMFVDTAKQYLNAVKTLWMSDLIECETNQGFKFPSEIRDGGYYVNINTKKTGIQEDGKYYYPVLLESGGKSPWGNKDMTGYVFIAVNEEFRYTTFSILLSDGSHGINEGKTLETLNRKSITTDVGDIPTWKAGYCKSV